MSKFILSLTLLALGILITLSIIAPNSSAIWLASTTLNYNILRVVLMVALFGLLITNPPRNKVLRSLIGTLAIFMCVWSVNAIYQNQMKLLDSTSILIASISMGLAVLEYTPEESTTSSQPDYRTRHNAINNHA